MFAFIATHLIRTWRTWIEAAPRLTRDPPATPGARKPVVASEPDSRPAATAALAPAIASGTMTKFDARRPRRAASRDEDRGAMLELYTAKCAGCRELSRISGRPVFKYGFVTNRVDDRIQRLNRDRYAGLILRDGDWIAEPGFDTWEVESLAVPAWLLGGAIVKTQNSLRIRLPLGVTPLAFDAMLKEALVEFSFDAIVSARTPSQPDPRLIRYTDRYGKRPARAVELYAIRPRFDGERIVAAIRAIIADPTACRSPDFSTASAGVNRCPMYPRTDPRHLAPGARIIDPVSSCR
jgi:hypothetical protein